VLANYYLNHRIMEGVNKPEKLPVISSYEREKIESSIEDLKHVAETMRAILELSDFAKEKGIEINRVSAFDGLRHPDKDFGPGGALRKELDELTNRARAEQQIIYSQLDDSQKAEFQARISQKQ
jgi:hypothetical protein